MVINRGKGTAVRTSPTSLQEIVQNCHRKEKGGEVWPKAMSEPC